MTSDVKFRPQVKLKRVGCLVVYKRELDIQEKRTLRIDNYSVNFLITIIYNITLNKLHHYQKTILIICYANMSIKLDVCFDSMLA